MYRYSEVVLPDGKQIHPCSRDNKFEIMYNCTDKDIKFPKWSCVLNWFNECYGVFFLIYKWMVTNICTFYLLFFITMKISTFVIFTNSSYMRIVKHVLCEWTQKMLRKERLQHGNYCNEIMQYYVFSFRILHLSDWKFGF